MICELDLDLDLTRSCLDAISKARQLFAVVSSYLALSTEQRSPVARPLRQSGCFASFRDEAVHREQHIAAPGGIGAPDGGVEAGAASKAKIGSDISRHMSTFCDAIRKVGGSLGGGLRVLGPKLRGCVPLVGCSASACAVMLPHNRLTACTLKVKECSCFASRLLRYRTSGEEEFVPQS